MFAYMRGMVIELEGQAAIIETHGIGYHMMMPARSIHSFPSFPTSALVYTSMVIREQSQELYGFLTRTECKLFELLLTISGVGPKLALALVDALTPEELSQAIREQNTHILCHVPGVGKKTAERLLFQLKDKIDALPLVPSSSHLHPHWKEAISALTHLGFTPLHAQQAVQKAVETLSPESDLGSLIGTALQLAHQK